MDIKEISDDLINESYKKRVQDIYIMPNQTDFNIYYRYSKKRTFQKSIASDIGQQLISRFKYLGEMDIGERRKAQLGAMTYVLKEKEVRLRLSSVGDYLQRESLVIRLLYDLSEKQFRCFCPDDLKVINERSKKRGLYLFSGPVGSGKTSLMYYLAQDKEVQVITIEDPVEIEETAFLQLQVNDKIEQTYEELLKLALRHRPDLLIIGEIRDSKTANVAIRAALTGHRVFATVHARHLDGTEARILELVGRSDEFFDCLSGVIYQEILLDQTQAAAALWGYNFTYNDFERKGWDQSYEEAKNSRWRSFAF